MTREEALLEFKSKMAGIEFMLGHGTCLGAYRDHALIEDDHDIDIWIFKNSLEDVEKVIDCPHRTLSWKHNQHTFMFEGYKFDLVFWQKAGDEYHLNFTDRPPDVLPARLAETKPIEFLGETFLIPKYTDEYLTYYYEDWRTKSDKPATIRK